MEICLHFGFEPERQILDIVGSLIILFARSYEWREAQPLWLFQGDVKSAFDWLSREAAEECMMAAGWPINLIAAVHSANLGGTCDGTIAGMEYEELSWNKCYKQGSIEGPNIWAMLMCHLIALLLPVWHECNYGFVVDSWIDGLGNCRHEPKHITHFIFADNLWPVASSPIVLH